MCGSMVDIQPPATAENRWGKKEERMKKETTAAKYNGLSSQYGKLRPTSGWDRLVGLGHPSKFQRVSRHGFVTAPTSLNGGQPNFARCLAVSWAGTLYIHFRGLLPLNRIPPYAKLTLRPSLTFSYILAVLLHGTLAVVVSQALRRSAEVATHIPHGHHDGHRPAF